MECGIRENLWNRNGMKVVESLWNGMKVVGSLWSGMEWPTIVMEWKWNSNF